MGVKFKSPLELSGHRAIAHTDVAQTLVVKVVTKTNAHPEYGNGSSNGYTIDGVEGAYLEFTPGNTYKFDQSDSSNSGHPLLFYEDAAKTTAYTTGVTNNHGSTAPGNSGSYTQIIPTVSTPPILYYQCSNHGLMGSYVKFGTGSQGDTYTLSASQDGNNVDLLLDAGSGTDSTVQLTAGNNITLTRSSAQEVEIASSGGGGGTVTVQKNVYTANGSTTAFNTTSAIANENNVQVYLDGVYQSKDNYTTSGSTVTISTAPANGTSVELIHMVAIDGVIARDSFTGNGSTTAYVLSMSISDENATQVYLDGVYQSKDNYSTSGSTLTFSTAPPNGTAIEVVHIKAVNASSLNQNNFTGNGSTTAFTLSQSIDDEVKTFVFIQGVYQEKSTYSISGTTLTFSTPPQNGYTVEVMAFSTITVGNQVAAGVDWQSTVQTSNFTAAAGKGYFVNTTSGTVTVSLPAGNAGDEIHFTDYASTFDTNKLALSPNGSEKILGAGDPAKCIIENATVYLIYQDATKGWTANNIETDPPTFNVNYLVVGGGGAGGSGYRSGGGGAGALRTTYGSSNGGGSAMDSVFSAELSTNYTVTVGAGGTYNSEANGSNGSNSVFGSITAIGGGGGGGPYAVDSDGSNSTGGSGGGGGGYNGDFGEGGTSGTYGYNGGDGISGPQCGGGGGGAGAVGKAATAYSTDSTGGNGGDGIEVSITGTATYYAGGGSGGNYGTGNKTQPGLGGGGAGGSDYTGSYTDAYSGTDNTGGGGGGSSNGTVGGSTTQGGAGGSGIVVLRYSNAYNINVPATLVSSTKTIGSDKVTVFTSGTGNIQFQTAALTNVTDVDYLIVGGGGGAQLSGGGAGGLRTSYGSTSGGGASAEATLSLTTAKNYSLTVGAGGSYSGSISLSVYGYPLRGNNSSVAGITSIGGGGGTIAYAGIKDFGGSGGGGTGIAPAQGNLSGGAGTAGQGYAGGSGIYISGSGGFYGTGGGGGASAVGTNAGPGTTAGSGGAGLSVSITGSAVTYAGGGGGGVHGDSAGYTSGSGGAGGGANAAAGRSSNGSSAGNAGTANTGGGGGGYASLVFGPSNNIGGAGGSGIIILTYSNAKTITLGSGLTGTTATSGSDKITTITAGTGNIQFN